MTQAEKDKIIKDLQEKLAEAEKIEVDEPKRWLPSEHETYWFISSGGIVARARRYDGDTIDNWYFLTGNCFKTEKEADERKKQIEYTARYKNYIEEHSEPIDWENYNQRKFFARYDHRCTNGIEINDWYAVQFQGVIYASSEQIIKDAIKEIGEDNFKKYVLGVK